MSSGSVGALVAGACFLLAALAHARRWQVGAWLGAAGASILTGALIARGLRAGHWPLTGEYEFALRRWPREVTASMTEGTPPHQGEDCRYEAGKALPIAKARLRVGRHDLTGEVKPEQREAVLTATLPKGRTTVQTWFYDADGKLVDFSGGMLTQSELEERIEKSFGVEVKAADAAKMQAPIIPLIPQGAVEMLRNHADDGTFAVIDARTAAEFAAGHIEGATNIDATSADLDKALAGLSKERSYIVYDQKGEQSAVLTQKMHDLGFKHLYDLEGGLDTWTSAGMPTTR